MENELTKYIKALRSKGISDSKIKQILVEAGHKSEDIESLFITTMKPKRFSKKFVFILLLILSILIVTLIIKNYLTRPDYIGDSVNEIKGWKEYYDQDYISAIELFKVQLEKEPNNWKAHHGLAWSYFSIKDFNKAEIEFSLALENNPNYPYIYQGLGGTYIELERYDEAEIAFKKAINLNPKESIHYFGLAITYQQIEEYENARQAINKAIDLNPLSTYYVRLNEIEDKIKNFN